MQLASRESLEPQVGGGAVAEERAGAHLPPNHGERAMHNLRHDRSLGRAAGDGTPLCGMLASRT